MTLVFGQDKHRHKLNKMLNSSPSLVSLIGEIEQLWHVEINLKVYGGMGAESQTTPKKIKQIF